jgi:hypothetical protein
MTNEDFNVRIVIPYPLDQEYEQKPAGVVAQPLSKPPKRQAEFSKINEPFPSNHRDGLKLSLPNISIFQSAMTQAPKLLDLFRERIPFKHYSLRTGDSYVQWIRRFILFHGKRHPSAMGAPEAETVLLHPSVVGHLAASYPH